jgi:hypothetical protein
MSNGDERIKDAVRQTEILRHPRQTLATFGNTNIGYYMLTEPVYHDIQPEIAETVVRRGRVIAQRPRIVTPYYLSQVEGFSDEARHYYDILSRQEGGNAPGIIYSYRNQPQELNIIEDKVEAVAAKINADIDQQGDPLTTIIKGRDELWDVSLLKFIYEMTRSSYRDNLRQFQSQGLLNMDESGVPLEARMRIEGLFEQVQEGNIQPNELKDELMRWGLFEQYQDRFFAMFGR